MQIDFCHINDFFEIKKDIADFWGSDRTLYLHHPMLIYEFGNTAFLVRDDDCIAAYLLGFFSQTENLAYVHLVGVRARYQRQGLGRKLYCHFIRQAQDKGIQRLKAITTADNHRSIAFHTRQMGMHMLGEPGGAGVPVVRDYSGPGMDRVVFEMDISSAIFE